MFVLQVVLDPYQPSLKGLEPINWRKRWPWMICEPDEKEGRFLLNETALNEIEYLGQNGLVQSSTCARP